MTTTIRNPVLRGFHPDPSILRVGDDYYLAVSTFEWHPGVRLFHSRDLVRWRLLGSALGEKRLLDLTGVPDSGGVWAPCLSYADGVYYLAFTNVRSLAGAFKDTPNYVVTAPHPSGPWSDPVYLNSSGFDPSLFHDEDGRTWLLNMVWDHRSGRNPFHGILLQEYSPRERRLLGEPQIIFRGTELGCTEGPHLYRKDGWYYLVIAEGGTGYAHAVTVARSRTIEGPYEPDSAGPALTSAGSPRAALQKAGHGCLVETQGGEWYLAHLCARPLRPGAECPLGRETALQRIAWADGWPRVEGGPEPSASVAGPALEPHPWPEPELPELDGFDAGKLHAGYSTLREPADASWLSLSERPGWLRLRGRESLQSHHRTSLVARRLTELEAQAETWLEFSPRHFQQLAGLVLYYNSKNHYYLRVSRDEERGLGVNVLAVADGRYRELLEQDVPIPEEGPVGLRADIRGGQVQFQIRLPEEGADDGAAWAAGDGELGEAGKRPARKTPDGESGKPGDGPGREAAWTPVGEALPLAQLSDERATREEGGFFTDWGFTGTFVGVCVQDLSGAGRTADFASLRLSVRDATA
ncbi:glycoside hydrolase family 43 protein [Paenibacillus albicereus]|uniref:Glycoside hydrolase family 43 protein n=1 Tax=Paenibacillus albicereus TaxID=2726185 RepID=A0A6H2GUA9_9BACL|nr:glycoside hydrolase family 43 protein [Paenibacillus albicereus]QJC50987.1 glycoside hydrolase family 43 protein [Paenibacillus albicereus]